MNAEQDILKQRKYDILVFGATGYTGGYVLEELIRVHEQESDLTLLGDKKKFRLAIAGRNLTKLKELVSEVLKKFPSFKETIDCLEADVTNLEKVSQATCQTKVVISCVGPFRLYGEPIVEACVLTGTHYVDITGEPWFVEDMFCKYNEEARRKNLMIVHYCGFDSVPADMGSLLIRKHLKLKDYWPLSVEMFVSFSTSGSHNAINYTTYESAICAMTSKKPSRNEIKSKLAKSVTYGPELTFSVLPRKHKYIKGYYTTFPAADALVVKMGQQIAETYPEESNLYFGDEFCNESLPSAKIGSYYAFKGIKSALFALFSGLTVSFFTFFSWGKDFLLKYPHWVTFGVVQPSGSEGPKVELVESGSFSVKFLCKGINCDKLRQNIEKKKKIIPEYEVEATFSGPDAGYCFTSKSVVMAGLTILKEKVFDERNLPRGVLTPSTAFGNTLFLERLKASAETIKFDISQD